MPEYMTDEELAAGESFCSHCAAHSDNIRRAEYRTHWRSRPMRANAFWYSCAEHMPLDRAHFERYRGETSAVCYRLDVRYPDCIVWEVSPSKKTGVSPNQ